MKYLLFILFTLIPAGLYPQDSTPRTFKLEVVNKRGKPVRNGSIFSYLGSDHAVQNLSRQGTAEFEKVTDSDTLFVVDGERFYTIPLEGIDSIRIAILNDRAIPYYGVGPSQSVDTGYGEIDYQQNVYPAATVNFDEMSFMYNNLAEYLNNRVAGLEIKETDGVYTAIIRGIKSISPLYNPDALVVVNGSVVESFDYAVRAINVTNIASVNILKDGAMYGSRGANGVILITTK